MAEAADVGNTGASEGAGGAPRLADMAGARDHDLFTSTDEPELEFDTDIGTDLYADKEGDEDDDDDVHDYTTRLPTLPWDFELAKEGEGGAFRGGAITPEGLIDEDFERELGMPGDSGTEAARSEFHDIEKLGIVDVAGDDMYGRKVIVVSACKLPPSQSIDHQRLLAYIKRTLDRFVEQDYVLVYFHYGLNSRNRPKLRFLLQAYKELNRQYKKNLKTLYLVHPTNFIKVLWNIFRPFISVKFGKKLVYVNYLVELKSHLHMDQLPVPKDVLEFDLKKFTANRVQYPYTTATPNCKRQQFGLSLTRLRERDNQQIPIVVEETVRYLREHGGAEVEGIFRRCANVNTVKEVQNKYNSGLPVNYADYPDMHVPAAILKKFLRELEEPLMTFDLFEPVTRVQYFTDEDLQTEEVRRIIVHELPEDNYVILKFIMQFLIEVKENCEVNKMTAENIATVFGPNLAWSKGVDRLSTVEPVIKFTQLLIQKFDTLFVR